MKVTKKTSVAGQYAKLGTDFEEGDIIKILNGGDIVTTEYGDSIVFKIETKNGERNMRMNQTSQNYIIDAFGDESSDWVGKEVKVWVFDMNISGKMKAVIFLTAPTWIKTRIGGEVKLVPSASSNPLETAPVTKLGEVADDINPDDIPF